MLHKSKPNNHDGSRNLRFQHCQKRFETQLNLLIFSHSLAEYLSYLYVQLCDNYWETAISAFKKITLLDVHLF